MNCDDSNKIKGHLCMNYSLAWLSIFNLIGNIVCPYLDKYMQMRMR